MDALRMQEDQRAISAGAAGIERGCVRLPIFWRLQGWMHHVKDVCKGFMRMAKRLQAVINRRSSIAG